MTVTQRAPGRIHGTSFDFEAPRLLLVTGDQKAGGGVRAEELRDYRVTIRPEGPGVLLSAVHEAFDVIVLDEPGPVDRFADAITCLRAMGVGVPIVLLAGRGGVDARVAGLDAGANDCLSAPFDADEVCARLRAVRRAWPVPNVVTIDDWSFRPGTRHIHSPESGRIALTPTEDHLLTLLAGAPDRTLPRSRLLKDVFGSARREGTVDTYVHSLRRKTTRDLIVTVRGFGYRLGPPERRDRRA